MNAGPVDRDLSGPCCSNGSQGDGLRALETRCSVPAGHPMHQACLAAAEHWMGGLVAGLQHAVEKLLVALRAIRKRSVITGIMRTTGGSEIGAKRALRNEPPKRTRNAVRTARPRIKNGLWRAGVGARSSCQNEKHEDATSPVRIHRRSSRSGIPRKGAGHTTAAAPPVQPMVSTTQCPCHSGG